MSYDYSVWYLQRNSDLVEKLIALAQSGEVRQVKNVDPDPLKLVRFKVSNILASLALNYPEYKDIRKNVRTWVTREDDIWVLNIGRPQHKILGRPPTGQTNPDWETPYFAALAARVATKDYQHEELVKDIPTYERLVGRVTELPTTVENVRAEFAQTIETLDPFIEVFPDWNVNVAGPTTLTLTRKAHAP